MIAIDNYWIEQYPNENRVTIHLPQTARTCTNTISPVENRRVMLTDDELATLLLSVIQMYKDAGVGRYVDNFTGIEPHGVNYGVDKMCPNYKISYLHTAIEPHDVSYAAHTTCPNYKINYLHTDTITESV